MMTYRSLVMSIGSWPVFCSMALFGFWTPADAANVCYLRTLDDPFSGRVMLVGNHALELGVAPQYDRPFYGLRPADGPELLVETFKGSNDFVALIPVGGSHRIIPGDAGRMTMEILSSRPDLSAVHWSNGVDERNASFELSRRVAIVADAPAVFVEATVHNRGRERMTSVAYRLQLLFQITDGLRLSVAGESLNAEQLRGPKLRRTFKAAREVVIQRDGIRLQLRPESPSSVTLSRGGVECVQVQFTGEANDLPPGGQSRTRMVWTITTSGLPVPKGFSWDWSSLKSEPRPVEPLVVRDTPPANVAATPVVARQGSSGYYGLFGGHSILSGHNEMMPLWAAVGARWQRNASFGWGQVGTRPEQYDFCMTDRYVAASERMGIRLVGLLMDAPLWATRDGAWFGPPKDTAAWKHYIETIVGRYRGRVSVWEIWNEPDLTEFWTGTPEDHVALLAAAYRAAKRANPDCLVMMAGADGRGERYLQKLLPLGAAQHCDLIGFHAYANTPEAAEKRVRSVWRILNYHGVSKPLWITEIGWSARGPRGGVNAGNENVKAEYLTDALTRLRPLAEVVFRHRDMLAGELTGLATPDGVYGFALNAAYNAYRSLARPHWGRGGGDLPLRFDLPSPVTAPVGKKTVIKARLSNTTTETVTFVAEMTGMSPAQARLAIPTNSLPSRAGQDVRLEITPSRATRAGKHHFVVTLFSDGKLVGEGWLTLDVVNDGPRNEVSLGPVGEDYALTITIKTQVIDVNGNAIGPMRLRNVSSFHPGERIRLWIKIVNQGTAGDSYSLDCKGTAAIWHDRQKAKPIPLKAGEDQETGIDFAIPPDAPIGTYRTEFAVVSQAHPEVQAVESMLIAVVSPLTKRKSD